MGEGDATSLEDRVVEGDHGERRVPASPRQSAMGGGLHGDRCRFG